STWTHCRSQADALKHLVALALLLALLLPGLRGIWDPDEGRYTNVALHMLDSGNWLEPHRSADVEHWTKPPLAYWAIAGSVAVFGPTPWAARLPGGLSYLLCAWLVWAMARRLVPDGERQAALAFLTMLVPFGAAQWISTDFVLAACESLAMWAYVEAMFGNGRHARRWLALMWAGFGLAFLAKGPPGLVPLLAIACFGRLVPSAPRVLQWWGVPLFAAIALPWYVLVAARNPGLLDYFVGTEVVDRIIGGRDWRHGQWYGWALVFAPTLLLGTLPWTPALWRWLRGMRSRLHRWRTRAGRSEDPVELLLASWVAVPLLVFCLAQSRMPLYILPLFVPLALLVARQRVGEGRGLPGWPRLLAWAALLLGLQAAVAQWPTHKDAAAWKRAIAARTTLPVNGVYFVDDMVRHGLHLHLGVEVRKLSLQPRSAPIPRFNPVFDGDVAAALAGDHPPCTLWIARQEAFPAV